MKSSLIVARDDSFRNALNDRNGDDFALGIVIGTIHTSFLVGFGQRNQRSLTSDEMDELIRITLSKVPQLKEAIFKCG
ncbi:MAG: hypothetical protein WD717_03720 [Nitrosarchaeum sp.]